MCSSLLDPKEYQLWLNYKSINNQRVSQPPTERIPGVLRPGINYPGHETDHSPPTRAEVKKKVGLYEYIHSPIRLHGVASYYLSTGTNFSYKQRVLCFSMYIHINEM
jgi:hypothetical protein